MAISNKVKFGIKNVHYAMMTVSSAGVVSYGTPKALAGAVNLALDPQGDTNTFYADDMAYHTSTNNEGYSGSMEMALIPDDFRQDVLGDTLHATAKVLIEMADLEDKQFALLFETGGDRKPVRHVLYNCVATRPGVGGKTTENSRVPTTESVNITASPLADGKVKCKTTADTTDAVYNAWFSSVWTGAAS